MKSPAASRDFWSGKRVLVTGHTGFKGAWLAVWLDRLGARVTGLALAPPTQPNLFDLAGVASLCRGTTCDVRDAAATREAVRAAQPEIVFHLAAQSLVRRSYEAPVDTFETNVMGTAHVLDAVRCIESVRVAVMVATDKVYRNTERGVPFREDDALGGHDPYSASKAASEVVVESYRRSFLQQRGVAVASARAGNVIGGGDWAADRLVPDAVRAWSAGGSLRVRRPDAVRPWQHVLEPLSAYLALAQRLWADPAAGEAFNFGPGRDDECTVRDVVALMQRGWADAKVEFGGGDEGPHEAQWLRLDATKAATLGIRPRWHLGESVDRTMGWYQALRQGHDALALCRRDLEAFEAAA